LVAVTPTKPEKGLDPFVLDELIQQNENLRQEKLSLETSNMVLQKFKAIYSRAEAMICSGCHI